MNPTLATAIIETDRLDGVAKIATLIAIKSALIEQSNNGGFGPELSKFIQRVEVYAEQAVDFLLDG